MKELKEKIEGWKKEHGRIYKTTIDGESFIWRTLKRKEYVALMSEDVDEETDPETRYYERQEKISKMVILHPEDSEKLISENGGLATTISEEVISKSGFGIPDTEEL